MNAPLMVPTTACRSCGAARLHPLLDLGTLPLANHLLTSPDEEAPSFPLTLLFCAACSLVQIRETVRPDVLFGYYLYFSSFSDGMLIHAAELAAQLKALYHLDGLTLVVEIASNDGYLLKAFQDLEVPVLGIEPASNIAKAANSAGIPTLPEFFSLAVSHRLSSEGSAASVVVANNVLAHVADLNDFVAGLANLILPEGGVVIEVPYVRCLVEETQFDTIYHEHLCYFSLHSLVRLFERHGLRIWDVERIPLHGGSLKIIAGHVSAAPSPTEAVETMLADEEQLGMTSVSFYLGFANQVKTLLTEITAEIARRKSAGERLAAYGASAKGSTLMNAAGLGAAELDFIVDKSTVKQGKFAPGNGLPVLSPDVLEVEAPDAVLLLTWNFAGEIIQQQAKYLRGGGTFIIPVPEVTTVTKDSLSDD